MGTYINKLRETNKKNDPKWRFQSDDLTLQPDLCGEGLHRSTNIGERFRRRTLRVLFRHCCTHPVSVEMVLHEGVGTELQRSKAVVARLHVNLVEHLAQERLELVEVLLADGAGGVEDEHDVGRLTAA